MLVHSVGEEALVLATTYLTEENDKGAHYSAIACCYHVGKKGQNGLSQLFKRSKKSRFFCANSLLKIIFPFLSPFFFLFLPSLSFLSLFFLNVLTWPHKNHWKASNDR